MSTSETPDGVDEEWYSDWSARQRRIAHREHRNGEHTAQGSYMFCELCDDGSPKEELSEDE